MVTFNFEGKAYELGFNRSTAKQIEARGFNINEISSKANTNIPLLVWGAFQWKHKGIPEDKTMNIFGSLGNKEKFVEALISEFVKTTNTLLEDASDTENLIDWSVQ